MARTMRVAYFSPLVPTRTRASHYSEELLPHLCRRMHVDVYTDDRVAAEQEVGRVYPLYGYCDFGPPERYDQLVFQIGNDPEHLPICDLFLRYGGVAVLHDLDLPAGTEDAPLRQEGRSDEGPKGRRGDGLGRLLRTAGEVLLHREGRAERPGQPEMAGALARQASGLIVHSQATRERLLAHCPTMRVRQVPLAIRRPPAIDRLEARRLLELPAAAFICLSAGRLGPSKRLHLAMQAFARLLERRPECLYVLVGEPAPGYPLQELAETLGIGERVRLAGYADLATLYRYLAACDVGIGLRDPGPGEASASLLRIMSMGKPVVVSDCEAHAQLPDDSALKIESGPGEVAKVTAALWALCGHPPLREWYGRRAARYVQANHAPPAAARAYQDFLEELATVEEAEEILRQGQPGTAPAAPASHGPLRLQTR